MSSEELRQKFLEFFKERGHKIIPSSSLIPENDPTTLFIGSGMQPLISYLLGRKHPLGNRLTNYQKCFRAEDIEDVGDGRHTTFFEMLGNWSLGDYYKKEQLNWIFEFLTKELKVDPKRLYVTVFRGNKGIGIKRDEESLEIWKEIFSKNGIKAKDIDLSEKKGMQDGRIFYYDETKNWWSRSGLPKDMPAGEPGGPDSEIFYDFGKDLRRHENSIWKDKPCHVNCGCGRFIEIGNNVFMEYIKTEKGFEKLPQKNVDFGGGLERITMVVQGKTNVFETDLFINILKKIEELSGGKKYKNNSMAFEIITDHIKGAVFIISEGVLPSNTEQGYVLRRLLRRAIRYGRILEISQNFLIPLAQEVIEIYKDIYPEIKSKKDDILTIIQNEEEKFEKTLEKGLKQFEKISKKGDISGIDTFHLFDTYGFPLELTKEVAKEKGLKVDVEGFKKAFEKHREISRVGQIKKFGGHGINKNLAFGENLVSRFARNNIQDTRYKIQITKLHTATHLLLQALRITLDDKIEQKGSDITPERLRLDFPFPRKLTAEEIKRVENIVNQKIEEDLMVHHYETSYEEAIHKGALGSFKDRYPEKVTVYEIEDSQTKTTFSREICAGPHVKTTKEIGSFKILKEEAVGQGIRRIKATVDHVRSFNNEF